MPEGSVRPGPVNCDPGCLNCRGGLSNYYRVDDDYKCLLCGGQPYPCTAIQAVSHSKIGEAKALLRLYKLQLTTHDETRGLTLGKLQRLVSAMQALENGQVQIGPVWRAGVAEVPDRPDDPQALWPPGCP